MALIKVLQGVWTKLATNDSEVFHKNGISHVYYIESEDTPVGFDAISPVMAVTDLQDGFNYCSSHPIRTLWAYCSSGEATVTVTDCIIENTDATSSFNEKMVAEKEPLIQLSAIHGISQKILPIAIGGSSVSVEDSMFKIESGTAIGSLVAVLSEREITARSGQSIECIISHIFDTPVIGNLQQAGFITSETAFAFAYNESGEFGVVHTYDGALEIQDLVITAGASADENADITVDDILYSVPITNSSINENAYEIATYLGNIDPRYNATSNGATVTFLAVIPDIGTGAFTFSSGTAAASFEEIAESSLGTSDFIKKSDWNVNPDFDINPQMGNTYKIQYAFTGFDGIEFYISNPETNRPELVHLIKYGNKNIKPSAANPIFRVGWAMRNVSNSTTNVVMRGASAAASNVGLRIYDAKPNGVGNSQNIGVPSVDINVMTVRSRRVQGDTANRSDSLALDLTLLTESTKITTFKLFERPVVDGYLDFEYVDEPSSLIEVAKNSVEVIGGDLIAVYDVLLDKDVNVRDLIDHLSTGETISITANVKSGGTADCSTTFNYKDDI